MSASPPPPTTSPPSPVIHIPAPRPLTRDDVRLMLDLSQPDVAREIEQLLDDEASKAQSKVPKYTLKLKDITKQYVTLQDKGEAWAKQLVDVMGRVETLRREVAYMEERKECWDEVVGKVGVQMLKERMERTGKKTGSKGAGKKRKPSQSPILLDLGSGKGGSGSNKGATGNTALNTTQTAPEAQHYSSLRTTIGHGGGPACTTMSELLCAVLSGLLLSAWRVSQACSCVMRPQSLHPTQRRIIPPRRSTPVAVSVSVASAGTSALRCCFPPTPSRPCGVSATARRDLQAHPLYPTVRLLRAARG